MPRVSEGSQVNGTRGDFAKASQADGKRKDLATVRGEGCTADAKKILEFPEDLVERIISRMPFPSVFKARSLSRTWYFKFPLPSQCVRSLSLSLQEHIASVSPRWPIYCPVYVSEDGILGFDRAFNQWRSMLTLSYLPVASWSSLTSSGSLICVISESDFGYNVFVTNVITKCWRKLPNRPHPDEPDHVRVLPLGTDGYRVLLVSRRTHDEDGVHTQIYNSKLKTWTVKKSRVLDLDTFFVNSAYLDEKLYFMCRNNIGDPLQLWVYDVRENSWTAITHWFTSDSVIDGAVLRCGDKVMVAIWFAIDPDEINGEVIERLPNLYTAKNNIGIYELLPSSLILQDVDTGPPAIIMGVGLHRDQIDFASDADFIYFGQSIPSSPVLTFNMHTHEWGCLPPASYSFGSMDKKLWQDIAFEPGLNPFMVV